MLTPYCVCGRGCLRSNECVTTKALSLSLVVVPVGDVCGSEESLTGFFFAFDVGDLEEPFRRVVEEPRECGSFGRVLARVDAGRLVVVAQLDGIFARAGTVRPMRRDKQISESDSESFKA